MDTYESTTEASDNQMHRDEMNMRKEVDEFVRDNLLLERKIDISALLRKNRMLEKSVSTTQLYENSCSWLKDYRPNN